MMNHLNELSIIILVILVFYTRFVLSQSPKVQQRILKTQLTLVLLYNIAILFIFPGKLPVELSTVSYFVIPIVVLFNIKSIEHWAVYSAIMAGGIYYLAMIFFGTYLYSHFPPYSVYTSLYNHGAILTYAFITMYNIKFYRKDQYIIWIGLVLSIIWALALRPYAKQTSRIFIYEILDAKLMTYYLPDNPIYGYVLYYILLALFLYATSFLVYGIHTLINKLKPKKMEVE